MEHNFTLKKRKINKVYVQDTKWVGINDHDVDEFKFPYCLVALMISQSLFFGETNGSKTSIFDFVKAFEVVI